jgi:hypothetical protein
MLHRRRADSGQSGGPKAQRLSRLLLRQLDAQTRDRSERRVGLHRQPPCARKLMHERRRGVDFVQLSPCELVGGHVERRDDDAVARHRLVRGQEVRAVLPKAIPTQNLDVADLPYAEPLHQSSEPDRASGPAHLRSSRTCQIVDGMQLAT